MLNLRNLRCQKKSVRQNAFDRSDYNEYIYGLKDEFYKCKNNVVCIPMKLVRDGTIDCYPHGDDEEVGCPSLGYNTYIPDNFIHKYSNSKL